MTRAKKDKEAEGRGQGAWSKGHGAWGNVYKIEIVIKPKAPLGGFGG